MGDKWWNDPKRFDALSDEQIKAVPSTVRELNGEDWWANRYKELRDHHIHETKWLAMHLNDLYYLIDRLCDVIDWQPLSGLLARGVSRYRIEAKRVLNLYGRELDR